MISLGVLGPIAAWRDGREVPLRGGRQRALLAALAAEPGSAVPVDVLVDRVWGGDPPAHAANALQQQILKLRRVVGERTIVLAPPGYRLAVPPDALDSVRFERLLAEAHADSADRPEAAIEVLERALALWRGPAFADVAYEDWPAGEAARLEELRLEAEELRVAALIRARRAAAAIRAVEPLVRANPLRERLHALKMLALYGDGRQAESLAAYATARATLVDRLGIEPGPELRRMHERVLRQDRTLDGLAATPVAVGAQAASGLIGRDAELADVHRLLLAERERLVTITGPGGVGKTALAWAAVSAIAATGEHEPPFVELAALREAAQVIPSIARALAMPERDTINKLADALAARRLVVVLDNFEHLTGGAASVAAVLDAAPELQLLITSRIPLRLPGEVVLRLPTLSVPQPGADMTPAQLAAASAAARVFVQRARAADPAFTLDAANSDAVAGLCRALDGLPLALELAAARLRHISLAELHDRLDRRLALLTSAAAGVPARHRSLRAAIDVSHELLDAPARVLFVRLAAFAGGATLAAIEAVCGDDLPVLDGLGALIDGHLVLRREVHGRSRYEMLETVAEYARERLALSDDRERVFARLDGHLLEIAEGAYDGRVYTIDPPVLDMLADEHANFVAALERAAAGGDGVTVLRLATALGQHWYRHGYRREGVRWIRGGLALAPSAPAWLRARALAYDGALSVDLGDADLAERETSLRALALAEEVGDMRAELVATWSLGVADGRRGDVDGSTAWLERVLGLARRSHDRGLIAFALSDLAYSNVMAGRLEQACERSAEALVLARELDAPAIQASACLNLAIANLQRDGAETALERAADALAFATAATDQEATVYSLAVLGAALCALRVDEPAIELLGAADALLERLGNELQPVEARLRAEAIGTLRQRVGAEAFQRAWQTGLCTSPDDARELVAAARDSRLAGRRAD